MFFCFSQNFVIIVWYLRHWVQMNQASEGKRSSGDNVVMVDPLEAKRLAAQQMQQIQAREKLKVQYLIFVMYFHSSHQTCLL